MCVICLSIQVGGALVSVCAPVLQAPGKWCAENVVAVTVLVAGAACYGMFQVSAPTDVLLKVLGTTSEIMTRLSVKQGMKTLANAA